MATAAETPTGGHSKRLGAVIRLAFGIGTAAVALAGSAVLRQGDEAAASVSETLVVSLGDRVRVDAAPIACRVTRVAGRGLRPYVECRRAGAREGTYGAFFSAKDILVARFVGPRTARVVFRASHTTSTEGCN